MNYFPLIRTVFRTVGCSVCCKYLLIWQWNKERTSRQNVHPKFLSTQIDTLQNKPETAIFSCSC